MAISQSRVAVELREIKLREKPLEMLAVSPKGTVPVLITADGTVIDESLDIMRWALLQNDPGGWTERDDPALIEAIDGPFKAALDKYKYPHRYGLVDGIAYRDTATRELTALETRLEHQAYLAGESFGFTDIAIAPFIRQFAATDQAWFDNCKELSNLRLWLAAFLQLPAFNAVMHKYTVWQSGDEPTLFVH